MLFRSALFYHRFSFRLLALSCPQLSAGAASSRQTTPLRTFAFTKVLSRLCCRSSSQKIFAAQICLGPLRHRRLLFVQITRPQLPAGAASSQQGTVPGYPAQPDITPFAPVAPLPKNLCCANLFGTPTTSAAPLRANNSPAAARRRRRCRRPCCGAALRRRRARSAPLKTPARSLRPQHAESAL